MSGQYDSSKSSDGFFVLILIAVVGIYFIISNNFHLIAGVWKYIRIAEMGLFYYIPDWVPFYGKLEIKGGIDYLIKTPAVDLMPGTVYDFDQHYLKWFSWMPGIIMIYWGTKRILSTGGVSTRFNMEALLQRVAPLYPHLAEFVNDNPGKKPIIYKRKQKDTHKWAMSMSPREFSLMSPPMGLERLARKQKSLKAPIWDGKDGFDMDLAERAFKSQMGDRFTGINHLKEHERQIFNEFTKELSVNQDFRIEIYTSLARSILKVKGDKTISKKKLNEGKTKLYNYIYDRIKSQKDNKKVTFNPKEFIQEGTVAILVRDDADKKKKKDAEYLELQSIFKLIYAEQIMGQHAFSKVGLMELLDRARDSGVFATDAIKWVKKIDRPLWYCMSSVGRVVSFVESGGCYSHWLIEKQVGRPISHPEVSEAVQGLFKALELHITEE
jgi:hypothetical protein